jgi:Spy/CpxP family protein refolding chaperone
MGGMSDMENVQGMDGMEGTRGMSLEGMKMEDAVQFPKNRAQRSRPRRLVTAALILAGLVFAGPVQARPGKDHHGWGRPDGWIERHADELGIDDATLAEIQQIVEASREQAEAIYAEHRAARDAMHRMLEQDEPDFDAVMKQVETIGEIDIRKHKHRIATMLEIRAKLTPEQRSRLRELKDEMRERGGRGGHHHGDGDCG